MVKSWREMFCLLSVCPDREETIWCFSALHGLGQTLWFSAVSEWPQWQLRRLEGNLYWQQQCCKSTSTVGGRVLKSSLLFFPVLCECSWFISCSTLFAIWNWGGLMIIQKGCRGICFHPGCFLSWAPLFWSSMLCLLASGCRVHVEAGLQRRRDESVLCVGIGCQSPQQNHGR